MVLSALDRASREVDTVHPGGNEAPCRGSAPDKGWRLFLGFKAARPRLLP